MLEGVVLSLAAKLSFLVLRDEAYLIVRRLSILVRYVLNVIGCTTHLVQLMLLPDMERALLTGDPMHRNLHDEGVEKRE